MIHRLHEVVAEISGFDDATHADKVRLFAWVLHGQGKDHLKVADISACYSALHLSPPANLTRSVQALEEKGDVLKSAHGYRLAKHVRDDHETKHGSRPITIRVHQALASLPGALTSPLQKEYLDEAIACCKHAHAWRASALMAWNLAYDHFCEVIVSRGLAEFTTEYNKRHLKRTLAFSERSDLQEVNEREVVEVAKAAGITDKTQHSCLERNLGIRNSIAHPSSFPFSQPQAESFILEVVQTIVIGLRP